MKAAFLYSVFACRSEFPHSSPVATFFPLSLTPQLKKADVEICIFRPSATSYLTHTRFCCGDIHSETASLQSPASPPALRPRHQRL